VPKNKGGGSRTKMAFGVVNEKRRHVQTARVVDFLFHNKKEFFANVFFLKNLG
jgi:hypothetical protein